MIPTSPIPVVGNVYRFTSRNLLLGVCVKSDPEAEPAYARFEFIGVREKFGHRYLTTEYGWNITDDLGPLPGDIPLKERFTAPHPDRDDWVTYKQNDELFAYLEALG
jgi:hypothetical protein